MSLAAGVAIAVTTIAAYLGVAAGVGTEMTPVRAGEVLAGNVVSLVLADRRPVALRRGRYLSSSNWVPRGVRRSGQLDDRASAVVALPSRTADFGP
jgi:hypothetical protein